MVSRPTSFGLRFDLLQNRVLQRWVDIAEKNERRIGVRVGQCGLEIRENVELGDKRGALVHVLVVAPGPEEGFAGGTFEAGEIDVAMLENGHVFLCEVIADDGDHAHRREMAGGKSEVAGGAAEQAICFSVRRFNAIERDRSNYK